MFLVLGGSGLVGSDIVRALLAEGAEAAYTYHSNPVHIPGAEGVRLEITDSAALASLFGELKPECAVNTVALPSVDRCETDRQLAQKVNVGSAADVASLCMEHGSALAYISSAFVFGAPKAGGKPYTEADAPGPVNHYGETKLLAERATAAVTRHVIMRTDQIYGWSLPGQKKCFVERVLGKLEKGEATKEASDWRNCPTFSPDIAKAALALVAKKLWGTWHAAGPDFVSRPEWARAIAGAFGLDPALVVETGSSAYGLPARRPNCAISAKKAEKALGMRFLGVRAGLERMRETRGGN